MEKHFVTFYSPGTFVSEESELPIDSWNIKKAQEMAHGITERYNATPYAFQFSTRTRGPNDLDSKVTKRSALYHLGGRIETLAEVEARNDPTEDILRRNMRCNDIARVIINNNSWRHTMPFTEKDVRLDWTPRPKRRKGAT